LVNGCFDYFPEVAFIYSDLIHSYLQGQGMVVEIDIVAEMARAEEAPLNRTE
jgi:hypothetical protein